MLLRIRSSRIRSGLHFILAVLDGEHIFARRTLARCRLAPRVPIQGYVLVLVRRALAINGVRIGEGILGEKFVGQVTAFHPYAPFYRFTVAVPRPTMSHDA